MTLYYINKQTEQVCHCGFDIVKGDIVFLHSNYEVKTIYIDSPVDNSSIWRDYRFLDSKSLKSYTFPKTNAVVCKPYRNCKAEGDSQLLQKLITECKNEWLTDFLQETNSILSGICQYWDIDQLRRFTRDESLQEEMEDGEVVTAKIVVEDDVIEDAGLSCNDGMIVEGSHIKRLIEFCLDALIDYNKCMTERDRGVLTMLFKGYNKKQVADEYKITPERVRQIFRDAIELVKEEHRKYSEELPRLREENIMLRQKMQAFTDAGHAKTSTNGGNNKASQETTYDVAKLLITPVEELNLSARSINILRKAKIVAFAEIPQIGEEQIWHFPNCGRRSVEEIIDFLKSANLTLGMHYDEIVERLQKQPEIELNILLKGIESKNKKNPTQKKDNIRTLPVQGDTSSARSISTRYDLNVTLYHQSYTGTVTLYVGHKPYYLEHHIADCIDWETVIRKINEYKMTPKRKRPKMYLKDLVPSDTTNREEVIKSLDSIVRHALGFDIFKSFQIPPAIEISKQVTVQNNLENEGNPWTLAQDEELKEMLDLGFNYQEVGSYMGRSENAVKARWAIIKWD